MQKKTRILIVDDHAIVREGLVAVLSFQPDFTVAGEAENGQEAIAVARRLKPDVIVMDLMLPDIDGAEAAIRIRQELPDTRILILTSFGNSVQLSQALSNGVTGAITKNVPREELLKAIRATAAGERIIGREIRQTLREDKDLPVLSSRQQDILQSLSQGMTNKDIARQQGLSMSGTKFHILEIFRKLNVANRSEAVAIALRKHLLKI